MRKRIIGLSCLMLISTIGFVNVDAQRRISRHGDDMHSQNQIRKDNPTTQPTNGVINNHEWVDLGLSVKWATCNIGANNPMQYGDYFAWGEIASKDDYHSQNSKTFNQRINDFSGSSEYDAATAIWGEEWRMPSIAEFEELIDNCIFEWIHIDGAVVCKAISKKNGKSIIFPGNGKMINRNLRNEISYNHADGSWENSWGYYWSSTPIDDSADTHGDPREYYAQSLLLYGEKFGRYCKYTVSWDGRWFGMMIRPVTE